MIEVLEPQHPLLRTFVDSVYVLRKGSDSLEFTAYPGINTPVGLFRNTVMSVDAGCVYIDGTETPDHFAIACNQFSSGIQLRYITTVDEIAINFKPLGFASFSGSTPKTEKLFICAAWAAALPGLFNAVFETDDGAQQLALIEAFLLNQYRPLAEEQLLRQVLELLNDVSRDEKMDDIAAAVGVHYKQLYRLFKMYVGCSLAQYRNLIKFRSSVVSKLSSGPDARLVDICYDHGYTDQPHFIREFRRMTGETPGRLFRKLVSFGKEKVIFRMDGERE
jgi:AraC-like DNA-binding protein